MLSERIQKALANAGLGSRREIERWVADGRISIDGRVAQLGDQLAGNERICVDGRPIRLASAKRETGFLAHYKPSSARATDDEPEALALPRPKHGRWIDVAALDAKTSGLVVVTTDGELAHRLMRAGGELERLLAVRVVGRATESQVQQLLEGVDLEDGVFRVAAMDDAGGTSSNAWYHVTLRDSRQRGLRAAFAIVGLAVSRVIRLRYGPVELGRMHRGGSRPLEQSEVRALYAAAGLTPRSAGGHEPRTDRRPKAPRTESRPRARNRRRQVT